MFRLNSEINKMVQEYSNRESKKMEDGEFWALNPKTPEANDRTRPSKGTWDMVARRR